MKKLMSGFACLALAAALMFGIEVPNVQAARAKVNCDQVMQELNSGKKPKEVAKDLKISTSSVYRCRRREMKTAKKSKAQPKASSSPSAATH